MKHWKDKLLPLVARTRLKTRRHVPVGLRLPLGVLLIAGGVLGFLPVLGFWMIPLGVAVAALDIRTFRAGTRAAVRPPDNGQDVQAPQDPENGGGETRDDTT